MPAELVLLLKAKDEASAVLKGVSDAGGSMFDALDARAKQAGALLTAAGGAIEAFARSQQATTIQVRQNAAAIGMQESEYRKLATSLTNATFPLEDALELMETAGQRGLRDANAIRDYANFWDMVGDATGGSGPKLAEMGVSLENVGIGIHNQKDALAALGFIHQNTTQDVEDFFTLLEKRGPTLRNFGLDINDTAAILGLMEHELGLTGMKARQEFERAIKDSDGTLKGLLASLGVSETSFQVMRAEVDASSDIIQRNADIVADSMTPLQEWQSKIQDLIFENQHLIAGLAEFAPIMLVAGPAIGGLGTAIRGLGAAAAFARGPLLAMGATLLAPPMGLVIALVAAGVAIYVFRDEIRDAVESAYRFVQENIGGVRDSIEGALNAVLDFARNNWPEIVTLLSGPFAPLVALATDAFGVRSALEGALTGAVDWVKTKMDELIAFLKSLPGDAKAAGTEIGRGFANGILAKINDLLKSLSGRTLIPSVDLGPLGKSPAVRVPGLGQIPLLNTGTAFVPRDMLALIHRGEMVVPRPMAESIRRGEVGALGGGINIAVHIERAQFSDDQDIERIATQLAHRTSRKLRATGVNI